MRAVMVLVVAALAGCAATPQQADVVADTESARCNSLTRQRVESQAAAPQASWLHSIDPQITLSAYQLYCLKDTPLGL